MARKQDKEKWLNDMTPVCEKCGKTAPVDAEKSTPEWTMYVVGKPCECGGEFMPRFMLGQK